MVIVRDLFLLRPIVAEFTRRCGQCGQNGLFDGCDKRDENDGFSCCCECAKNDSFSGCGQ